MFGIIIISILILAFLLLPIFNLMQILSLKEEFQNFKRRTDRTLSDLIMESEQKPLNELLVQNFIQTEAKEQATIERIPQNTEPYEYTLSSNYEQIQKEFNIEQENSESFEKMFLGNIFNKIGAIAIIVAICIFVKIASTYIEFTPAFKFLTSLLVSSGFIVSSLYLFKKELKNYAQVLCGIGFAGCLISIYAGCSYWDILPTPVAVIFGFILICLSYVTAHKFDSFSTMVIGLIGGYLNPFFINHDISSNFLFGYLIIINLITILYVNKNSDKTVLNIANLIATALTVTIFSANKDLLLVYPIALWLVYFVNDFVLILKDKYSYELGFLNWTNFISLVWFVNYIFKFENKTAIGLTLLYYAIIYIASQIILAKVTNKTANRIYLQNALVACFASTYFLTQIETRATMWSIEALCLAFLYKKYNFDELKNYVMTFAVGAFLSIFFVQDALYNNFALSGNFGFRFISFLVPSISIYLTSTFLNKDDNTIKNYLRFMAISLMYIFAVFEINSLNNKINNKLFTYAILGSIYSINLQKLHSLTKVGLYKLACYLSFFISLILLLCANSSFGSVWAFEKITPLFNLRCLAFAFLIAASYYISKIEEKYFEYIAIILGAILIFCETKLYVGKTIPEAENILSSVSLILYSAPTILIGIFKNIKSLKLAGIWICLFSLVKIVFYDLTGIDAIFKLLAFIVLGVCLLATSYYYSKNNKD